MAGRNEAAEAWDRTRSSLRTFTIRGRGMLDFVEGLFLSIASGVIALLFAFGAIASYDATWDVRAFEAGLALAFGAGSWYFGRVVRTEFRSLRRLPPTESRRPRPSIRRASQGPPAPR